MPEEKDIDELAREEIERLFETGELSINDEAIQQVMNVMNAFSVDDVNGDDIFNVLFSLDDEKFSELSPIFLNELKKAFSAPDIQLLLVNSLNTSGVKYEDLAKAYNEVIVGLDTKVTDEDLSVPKKDFVKQMMALIINAIGETQNLTKRIVEIPIQLIDEKAKIPTYANVGDAAADIYALEDYDIAPGEQVKVRTGLKIELPYGYAVLIQPRSGISAKSKLRICNAPGLIDSGYRGEICVLVENIEPPIKSISQDEDKTIGIEYGRGYKIEAGDRIAQMRLVEVPSMAFAKVDEIKEASTKRGIGGFGSTGMK